ncbi:MAG: PASTA domain-containing protein [Ruminococcus sp.]|nr:PASTA domain-containing protein [Ruminococcus sp.]
MEKAIRLCMGCMNELDENGVCHYCKYTDDTAYLRSYLAPRTVLDNRYIVGKILSYNGEGASYICYDSVAKEKVVCREYMPDTLCERERGSTNIVVNQDCLAKYKTFMQEFCETNKALSRMRNLNHMVTAKDMLYENNTTYVILEYVEGVSLKKFLQSNTGFLSWEQVKKLFVPVFTTLSIIHNAGIIHRGISPENIIVTINGELKLTGFCISSIRTSNTGLSPEFYSGYAAPEQYSSLDWQGTWTDVYAISAVLYRILTGTVPLDALTRINNDTMPEPARVNPQVPDRVSKVLMRGMAVRGEERIQTITELVTALFEQPKYVEHKKGATQTIPVQKARAEGKRVQRQQPSKKNAARQPEPQKPGNKVMIAGFVGLVVLLAVALVLLYKVVSGGNDDSSSLPAVTSKASTTTTEKVAEPDDESSETEDDTGLGSGAVMANYIGYRYDSVKDKLEEGFNVDVDYFYSDSYEEGEITEQSIPAGTEYDPSRKHDITISVCMGSEYSTVPSYNGLTQEEYLKKLGDLRIKYNVVDYENSAAQGTIVKTSKEVGEKINIKNGEELVVYVSTGVKETTTTTSVTTTTEPEETTTTTEPTTTTEQTTTPEETAPTETEDTEPAQTTDENEPPPGVEEGQQ